MPEYPTNPQFSERLAEAIEQDHELKIAVGNDMEESFRQCRQRGLPTCAETAKIDFITFALALTGWNREAAVQKSVEMLSAYYDRDHPEKRTALLDDICACAARLLTDESDPSRLAFGETSADRPAAGELTDRKAEFIGFLRSIDMVKALDAILSENTEYADALFQSGVFPELEYECLLAAFNYMPSVSAVMDLRTAARRQALGLSQGGFAVFADIALFEFLAGICGAYAAVSQGKKPAPVKITLSDPARAEDSAETAAGKRSVAFEHIFGAVLAQAMVMNAEPLSLIFLDGEPLTRLKSAEISQDAARAEAFEKILEGTHTLDAVIPAYDSSRRLMPTAVSVEPDLHLGDDEFRKNSLSMLRRLVSSVVKAETPADRADRLNAADRASGRAERHEKIEQLCESALLAGERTCKKRGALARMLRLLENSPEPAERQDDPPGCEDILQTKRLEITRSRRDTFPGRCADEAAVDGAWKTVMETELLRPPLSGDKDAVRCAAEAGARYQAAAKRCSVMTEGLAAMTVIACHLESGPKAAEFPNEGALRSAAQRELEAMDRIPFNVSLGLDVSERSEYRRLYSRLRNFVSSPSVRMQAAEYAEIIPSIWRLAQRGVVNAPERRELLGLCNMTPAEAGEWLNGLRTESVKLGEELKEVTARADWPITRVAFSGMAHIGIGRIAAARRYADPSGAEEYLQEMKRSTLAREAQPEGETADPQQKAAETEPLPPEYAAKVPAGVSREANGAPER